MRLARVLLILGFVFGAGFAVAAEPAPLAAPGPAPEMDDQAVMERIAQALNDDAREFGEVVERTPQSENDIPQPAAKVTAPEFPITGFESDTVLVAETSGPPPLPGQMLALRSKSAAMEFIGFVEILSVDPHDANKKRVRARILRVSPHHLVRPGDTLVQLDLRTAQPLYRGHTELLVRHPKKDVSARYLPLFTQGFSIGETASTLGRDEFMLGLWGQVSYGLTDRVSVGTFAPGLLLSSPNGNMKYRVFMNDTETVSVGLTATKLRETSSTALNLNVFWDSTTSASMTSHTLITFAVATFEEIENTVAIKTAGTSSLQTGYEILLENWDRVLFGPSYNFETKTIGGYVAYKRIWDKLHLSLSVSTVDVRELKYSPKTGYVGLIEAYWRY